LKSVLNTKDGTLSVDGSRFLAPRMTVSSEPIVSPMPLSFLGQVRSEAVEQPWVSPVPVEHKCRGKCRVALRPKCTCGCHYKHHSELIRKVNHSIEEFLEVEGEKPSTPLQRVYA
jgi:hypothetical protein